MKITLHNFRCHSDSQFVLPDSGLVLLEGGSGAGKSTLIKGILYALFGNEALRKPYSFGKKTCSVTLEFLRLKIHRTNRPNRLLVNDDLEDAVGQAFINKTIGMGYGEFTVSSYIPQKNNSSILSITQTEQLKLIKTLAFEGDQNEKYKNKLKEMIRGSSAGLIEKRTERQVHQQKVSELTSDLKKVPFPLTVKDGETEESTLVKYRRRMRLFNKNLTKALEHKTRLNIALADHTKLTGQLENEQVKITELTENIQRRTTRREFLEGWLRKLPENLEDDISRVREQISFLKLEKDLKKLEAQFNQIRTLEQREQEQRIKNLESSLWTSQNHSESKEKLKKNQEQIQLYKEYKSSIKQLKKYQIKDLPLSKDDLIAHYTQVIEGYEKELSNSYKSKEELTLSERQLELKRKIVKCPECNSSLCWRDEKLVFVSDYEPVEDRDYRSEISALESSIAKIKKKIQSCQKTLQQLSLINVPQLRDINLQIYENLSKEVEDLSEYISENLQRERELESLKNKKGLTPALKKLKNDISIKQGRLGEIKERPILALENLQDQLRNLESFSNKRKKHSGELTVLKDELQDLKDKYKNSSKRIEFLREEIQNVVDPKEIQDELGEIQAKIQRLNKQQKKDEQFIEPLEEYSRFCQDQRELERWEGELAKSSREFSRSEKLHSANLILKEKYTRAEIMTLRSIINSINEHTKFYLELFFADHQLSVILEAIYKGDKQKTLKMNTSIKYKGNEYDDIGQLSGGEFDRCTLASICGINSMLGSPLLLLDESLSSLDEDTNTEIISFLNDLSQDKLVVVCSHEAVRGIFDNVIHL